MATPESTQMPSSLEEVEAVSTLFFIQAYLSEKEMRKRYSENIVSRTAEQVLEVG
jgi:hypothetical protein